MRRESVNLQKLLNCIADRYKEKLTFDFALSVIVLEKGKVIEEGTHQELTEKRGAYYELVKNQLELGV